MADSTGDSRPVGIFDSGLGGLTVARAVLDLLPDEDLLYIGDTGRYPYGPRPLAEVAAFADEIGRALVERHGVKLLVVACNTATAAAIDHLRATLPVPVVGVIEPGVRASVAVTSGGRVGVIATVGTVASGAYQRAFAAAAATSPGGPRLDLTCAACPGFVEFVERGEVASDQVTVLAERLLAPVIDAKVDTLLLGCTHYPFLARTISDVVGRDVVLVSSADETAFEVAHHLRATGAARAPGGAPARHRFLSSGPLAAFRDLGRALLGPEVDDVEPVTWQA